MQVYLPLIGRPTPHSSGTSIRGKTRVSQFANKKMKKLFHMGALVLLV
ncbi:transposase [Cesiribacter sp. SM1]